MRKYLVAILVAVAVGLTFSGPALADTLFLEVYVNGVLALTSTSPGTVINTGPLTLLGVSFTNIGLTSNSPGSPTAAFTGDGKNSATNTTGGPATVVVDFAATGFSLPAGSPLSFNASQTVDVLNFNGGPAITQTFTGFGDASNTGLVPTPTPPSANPGVPATAPPCTVSPGAPTNSCATTSPLTSFVRTGAFALSGIETFTLAPGQTATFTGSVNAAVPEPSSLLLVGTGLILLAGRRLRRK